MNRLLTYSLLTASAVLTPNALAQVPNPNQIYVQSISYGGTGCPQGTVGQSLSNDRSALTLIYDAFVASSGPAIPATEARKTCQININLHIPQGISFSLGTIASRGYVQLPRGVVAAQDSIYYYAGQLTTLSAGGVFYGPVARDYLVFDNVPFMSTLAACNTVYPVNAVTSVAVSPSPGSTAQITLDSTDGKIYHIVGFQYLPCY